MKTLWKDLMQLFSRRSTNTARISVGEKFTHFRAIGAANDAFLRDLAGLQDCASASVPAGAKTPSAFAKALAGHAGTLVRSLTAMSGGRYDDLQRRFETLELEISREILKAQPIEPGPLVIWPADSDAFRPTLVGAKAARLAEVASRTRMKVPPFFAVSIYGYHYFMQSSGIQDLINGWPADIRDPGGIRQFSAAIVNAIEKACVPPVLESALAGAYRRLGAVHAGLTGVAVRSSAVVEDGESSFAGQFESVLNVREAGLADAYKQVIASKYKHEALKYALARGFVIDDIAMPVVVMAMVHPVASGVAYSRCPERPESAMVTAVSGLAQSVVEHTVIPDTFIVSAAAPVRVESVIHGRQPVSLQCAAGGGLVELPEEMSAEPVLEEKTACEVARMAGELEDHFGSPQDVEWALDGQGALMVVQARPLHVFAERKRLTPGIGGCRILIKGAARASGGVAAGPVFELLDLQALENVPEGTVLCVPTTSPRLAGVMGSVRAVVAGAGSPTGHMATVAREFGVPCLVGAESALSVLRNGMQVTVDADAGIVYEGEATELLGSSSSPVFAARTRDPLKEKLQALVERVAPLTLPEPDAPEFCAGNCRTLHDIVRFAHQKSMSEMFDLEALTAHERRGARRLVWRVPMEVLLLDLGEGLAKEAERSVSIDAVKSVPLLALIEGMTDPRLRWAGPVGFDLKGFMSVVVRSAADDQRYGEPNYCLCAGDYVHFASRLAYHFATVDSICGRSVNENYARFLFFGGAAVAARREWRAHFLATVLRCNGFAVRQAGDRVKAMLSKRESGQIEEALVMLGRLMVASRHLDMMIESQAVAQALAQAFLSGDYGFQSIGKAGG